VFAVQHAAWSGRHPLFVTDIAMAGSAVRCRRSSSRIACRELATLAAARLVCRHHGVHSFHSAKLRYGFAFECAIQQDAPLRGSVADCISEQAAAADTLQRMGRRPA
jgi:hypothetical protein